MTLEKEKIVGTHRSAAVRLLKRRRAELFAQMPKLSAGEFLHAHSRLLDDYFRDSFEASVIGPLMDIARNPYAIVALGGYGREEQCTHSDVDLLFLFKKRVPSFAEALIKEVVYPLWDLNLQVGHATRSLKECLKLAAGDYEVLTSLLDARFICGVSILFTTMMEQLREKLLRQRQDHIIRWLIDSNTHRHERFGDSAYLLEPNLKEGKGGLRDYHTMLWIGRIRSNVKQLRDFEVHGYLSHGELVELQDALSFVWRIRNRLHLLAGRKCDQLHFEFQARLARALKFNKQDGQQPVERFLGALHGRMEFIKDRHLMFLYELGQLLERGWRKKRFSGECWPGLEIEGGLIHFTSSQRIVKSPGLLMKIFEESARLKVPLSAEAKRLVREFLSRVDDAFRTSPEVLKSFERVLVAQPLTFNVLNAMLNEGLLAAYIPEFQGIINRIQYDEYHVYPVDKHSLRVVKNIKRFGVDQDPIHDKLYAEIYHGLRKRSTLLWAALLHDIGKGDPGGGHAAKGAQIVRRIFDRLGKGPEDREAAAFLVEEHLQLVETATRRDINDEETALFCARRIGDAERLKMLYLLTVADCIGTGPKAASDWTLTLLRSLFIKVLRILEKGELASKEALEQVEGKKEMALTLTESAETRAELAECFRFMSPRYLLYASSRELLEHFMLFRRIGGDDFVWQIRSAADSNTRQVTICAKDRPGLFSKIAGVFTLNGIDILGAQVFTWRNGIALDIFEVRPPPDLLFESERWERAAGHLREALKGRLELAEALREKMQAAQPPRHLSQDRLQRVHLDNESSSFFTIVEVFAYDFPGLLYCITDALFRCQMDIWVAKIATKVDQVVDVFYVRDLDGQKIDSPQQIEAARPVLEGVLMQDGRRPCFD